MLLLAVPGILIAISAVNTAGQMQSGATTGFEFSAIYAVFDYRGHGTNGWLAGQYSIAGRHGAERAKRPQPVWA